MKILPREGKLSLTNDGLLELFFIGVGTAFARTLYQTNLLIIKGNTHVMVDFGMTGPEALRRTTGLEPTDIATILPTHTHADHVGGLECLGLMNRYVGRRFLNKPKLGMIITEEFQRRLWDVTLRGGMEWNERDRYGRKLSFTDFFDPIRPRWKPNQPRETWTVEHGELQIELFRTRHIPEQAESWEEAFVSYGLYIEEHRFFFSGDTQFDRDLIDIYAPKSDVMFHDVQFHAGGVHAPFEDLKTLPPEVQEKTYFTHYPDTWKDQDIAGFAGFVLQEHRYVFE